MTYVAAFLHTCIHMLTLGEGTQWHSIHINNILSTWISFKSLQTCRLWMWIMAHTLFPAKVCWSIASDSPFLLYHIHEGHVPIAFWKCQLCRHHLFKQLFVKNVLKKNLPKGMRERIIFPIDRHTMHCKYRIVQKGIKDARIKWSKVTRKTLK